MTLVGKPSRPQRALVAAASTIEQSAIRPYKPEQDSDELWSLYHQLAEIHYITSFKSNAARRLTYFAGRIADPDQDPEPVDDGPAAEAVEAIQGPIGDIADFVGEFATHLDVVGEAHLVGYDADSEFDVLSSDEYKAASGPQSQAKHQDDVRPITDADLTVRVWRPDPQWRYRADSPLRAVRHECETLILLRNMTQALTRSRLPAKILGIPEELSFQQPNPDTTGTGAETGDDDPFLSDLIKSVVTSVTDDRSAARFAPIFIRGAAEYLDKIKEIDLTRDMPEWLDKLVDQTLRRIASGLDIPAEILLGLADVNHWTAWQVDESAYKQHVDPLVLIILDSLTRGYLWPALEEANVADPRSFVLWRDYSDLTARVASVDSAIAVFDRGGLSVDALRRYTGFNDADRPEVSTEIPELGKRVDALGALIRAGFEPEASAQLLGFGEIRHTGLPPVTVQPSPINEPTGASLPAGPDTQDQGPPPSMVASAALELGQIDRQLFDRISEASQAALDRALERAGNKIVSQLRGGSGTRSPTHRALAAKISDVPTAEVGLVLGKQVVAQTLQLSDDELIPPGTFDSLGNRIDEILSHGQDQTAKAIEQLGGKVERNDNRERSWRERARDFLLAVLSGLALSKLFTPDTQPDPATTGEIGSTSVPAGDVFDTLTLAGGGEPAPDPTQPRGLATGAQAQDWLQAGGVVTTGYEWQVGAPKQPFEPHQNLAGTVFERWTSEVLAPPLAAEWLGVSFMFPGDHRGCQCQAVPIVESPAPEG